MPTKTSESRCAPHQGELKARIAQLDTRTPRIKRDILMIMMGLVGCTSTLAIESRVVLAIAAWNKGLALAAVWGLWAFAMCCLWYPWVYPRKEASPAVSSLVWSTKGDGTCFALAGVSFYVDGTRGEAPQGALDWSWVDTSLLACPLFVAIVGSWVWCELSALLGTLKT